MSFRVISTRFRNQSVLFAAARQTRDVESPGEESVRLWRKESENTAPFCRNRDHEGTSGLDGRVLQVISICIIYLCKESFTSYVTLFGSSIHSPTYIPFKKCKNKFWECFENGPNFSSQYYVSPNSDISEEDLSELPSCVYAGRSSSQQQQQHVVHTGSGHQQHVHAHPHTHSPLHYHMPVQSSAGNYIKWIKGNRKRVVSLFLVSINYFSLSIFRTLCTWIFRNFA